MNPQGTPLSSSSKPSEPPPLSPGKVQFSKLDIPTLPGVTMPKAIFDFPINCTKGHVAGLRVNGHAFVVEGLKVHDCVPSLHGVKELCIQTSIIQESRTPMLVPILDKKMPRLEGLRIDISLDDDHRSQHRTTYTLRAAKLPRLQMLMVRNASVAIEGPLYHQLRFLHFERSDPGSGRLPLEQLFQVLRQCPQLERIYVENYLNVPVPRANDSPILPLQLADFESLTHLAIADKPSIVPAILSYLVIPAYFHNTTIARTANSSNSDVDFTSVQFLFEKGEPRGDEGILNTAFQTMDVFEGTDLAKTLKIAGSDFRLVTKASWAATLGRFPDVEVLEIEVTDRKPTPLASFNTLLAGLVARSPIHRQVVCARLRRLVFTADVEGASSHILNLVCNCLLQRTTFGALPLRELCLHLTVDKAWDAATEARYRQRLSFAASVVEIMPLRVQPPRKAD